MLLAPYFYETTSDAFNAQFDGQQWRSIHAWESFDEMCSFFHQWLGLKPIDSPPQLVMRGIHALRGAVYPAGYWSAFFEAASKANVESKTFLKTHSADLAQFQRPTLVITAALDTVCDPQKLLSLEELFKPQICTLRSVECGHFFGPKGATICELAHPHLQSFLSR